MRSYLEAQIMPLLLEALSELVKNKPQDPIEYIANYMLEHNPEKRWIAYIIDEPLDVNGAQNFTTQARGCPFIF